MNTKETGERGDKVQSTGCGCPPTGQGLAEMMSACCAGKDGFSDCSVMMKKMMETRNHQPCCASKTPDAESEGKTK